ncbi:condensin subunit ScpB [Colwellia chukchiensis]|uniref:Condensin subunit ScpB n=1 Tax=Colwellia chukchiensis TaxID=641665 RepID=A0A1H7R1L2_9GAMM|nr:SMC-Scp complex subunit ScpB [Colwellia chukchiensis]SEL53868.1 condensin subunit ScpB [Colwellia chukchiensis]
MTADKFRHLDIDDDKLTRLVEAALFIADKPVSVQTLKRELLIEYRVSNLRIRDIIKNIAAHYQGRGIELKKVASGYRFQTPSELSTDLAHLYKEKAPKYSRATLETLALIAYKQPITRSEIEDIRGVALSSQIIKTLMQRNWIKTVGHKEVPGRPVLYASTQEFLDYFSLTSLAQLPELMPLAELER